MTKEGIAQWVINNRYPKSEKEKVSDLEMYHKIVDEIRDLTPDPSCSNCKYLCVSSQEICINCDKDYSKWEQETQNN